MERPAAVYCRVSTENQEQEGTSLNTQEEACLTLAIKERYEVLEISKETYSGLTIDRPKLSEIRKKAKNGELDAIIVYSPDRLSRKGEDILFLVKEFKLEGVKLLFVKEQWDDTPNGKLIAFMLGWSSEFEASQIRERTMRGKKRHAEMGDIPSGFGRYSYWGLHYNKDLKQFDSVIGQIEIVKEILTRYIAGDSSSEITVDLQKRNILSATGGRIHRSAVNRVLRHANVYAGILTWGSFSIFNKVKPIITKEEATIIAERLKRNKVLSYGFGKRKPLTGRVFCGLCNKHYNLDAKKGCRCNGSDHRNPIKCLAPKIGLGELTDLVNEAIVTVMMDDEALVKRTAENREQWEKETTGFEEKLREKEGQLASFDKRRLHLSFQHELGGLRDDEYEDRLNAIDTEKSEFIGQIEYLKRFTPLEEPPKPEDVREALKNVRSVWEKLVCLLAKAAPLFKMGLSKGQEQDKQLQQLMDNLGIKAMIYPGDGIDQFKINVLVNIPIERKEIGEKVMVSPLSLCAARRAPARRCSPVPCLLSYPP